MVAFAGIARDKECLPGNGEAFWSIEVVFQSLKGKWLDCY